MCGLMSAALIIIVIILYFVKANFSIKNYNHFPIDIQYYICNFNYNCIIKFYLLCFNLQVKIISETVIALNTTRFHDKLQSNSLISQLVLYKQLHSSTNILEELLKRSCLVVETYSSRMT